MDVYVYYMNNLVPFAKAGSFALFRILRKARKESVESNRIKQEESEMKYVLTIESSDADVMYKLIDAENQNFVVDCGIVSEIADYNSQLAIQIREYEEER